MTPNKADRAIFRLLAKRRAMPDGEERLIVREVAGLDIASTSEIADFISYYSYVGLIDVQTEPLLAIGLTERGANYLARNARIIAFGMTNPQWRSIANEAAADIENTENAFPVSEIDLDFFEKIGGAENQ